MSTTGSFPYQALRDQIDSSIEQARAMEARLSAEQVAWEPPEGGWSVGQCFEHLVVSAALYQARMRTALARARAASDPPSLSRYRPTLVGRMLVRAMSPASRRRLKTPRVFAPPPTAREGVIEAFVARHEELRRQLDDAVGVNINRYKVTSPAIRLFRLNLGDAFRLLVVHAQRHLNQAARVTEHPEFPRSDRLR